MNKRIMAIILEAIPIIAAIVSFILLAIEYGSNAINGTLYVTLFLAFIGFVMYFVGRKLAGEDKVVKILGIFDWLSTLFVFGVYIAVFIALGQ